jgi:hypothetical protein
MVRREAFAWKSVGISEMLDLDQGRTVLRGGMMVSHQERLLLCLRISFVGAGFSPPGSELETLAGFACRYGRPD